MVATKVRKLAEDTSAQSKEIYENVTSMAERVRVGVTQTREAGEAFRRILVDIDETTKLINAVAAARAEQKTGTAEHTRNNLELSAMISQLRDISRGNVTVAEQLEGILGRLQFGGNGEA
ncbi:MAG: hypothetical protein ACOC2Y_00570 [Spirochaetota bacterium]